MDDTLPYPAEAPHPVDLPFWKNAAATFSASVLMILFVVAGVWKITAPYTWATMAEQLQVHYTLSLPLTVCLAIAETFSAVLIVIPRFRRWGAILIGLLLIVFMIYIGWNYSALVGKECSCFPWVKRSVGPGFFAGDLVMLALAVVAGLWSRPSEGKRAATVILGSIAVFALVSLGLNAAKLTGTKAPDTITADGKTFSLQHGRVFLFFYDPECMHCDMAAKKMSKLNWRDTQVVAIPTRQQQFAAAFLHDTGLKAVTSLDSEFLRKTFPGETPYGIALENGREKAPVPHYDDAEPAVTLKKLGFVE